MNKVSRCKPGAPKAYTKRCYANFTRLMNEVSQCELGLGGEICAGYIENFVENITTLETMDCIAPVANVKTGRTPNDVTQRC